MPILPSKSNPPPFCSLYVRKSYPLKSLITTSFGNNVDPTIFCIRRREKESLDWLYAILWKSVLNPPALLHFYCEHLVLKRVLFKMLFHISRYFPFPGVLCPFDLLIDLNLKRSCKKKKRWAIIAILFIKPDRWYKNESSVQWPGGM